VGPRVGLEAVEKIIFSPVGNQTLAVQPVAIPIVLSRSIQIKSISLHSIQLVRFNIIFPFTIGFPNDIFP
jgi:hypothetical protein